jgi:IS30 family transposase
MNETYCHLSVEERAVIMIQRHAGASFRSIGRVLGRPASTISREVSRNAATSVALTPAGGVVYDATVAGCGYVARRRRCGVRRKLQPGSALYQHVHDRLIYSRWSPQQIAARLRTMNPTDLPTVSHETIYAAIYAYPRGALKEGMIKALRQSKPARGLRRTRIAKGETVPEALRIVHRPEEVEHRLLPGHWEGDFIKGSFNRSAVGTVVEPARVKLLVA